MSPTALTPCPACNRHVRAAETRCPFCDAEQPARALDDGGPQLPRRRLGRAALMTAGALLGAAEACGDTAPTDDASTKNDSSLSDTAGNDGGPVALYGAPAPEYGVPPPPANNAAATAVKPAKT